MVYFCCFCLVTYPPPPLRRTEGLPTSAEGSTGSAWPPSPWGRASLFFEDCLVTGSPGDHGPAVDRDGLEVQASFAAHPQELERSRKRGPLCPNPPHRCIKPQRLCLCPRKPVGTESLCCAASHTEMVFFSAVPTAGFLVFKPELISRLEQGQEPWVLDLQGAEGREVPRTSWTGEA